MYRMIFLITALFLKEHDEIVSSRFKPILDKICGPVGTSPDEYERYYRLIIFGTLLYPGLGSPSRIAVIREATCAIYVYIMLEYFVSSVYS